MPGVLKFNKSYPPRWQTKVLKNSYHSLGRININLHLRMRVSFSHCQLLSSFASPLFLWRTHLRTSPGVNPQVKSGRFMKLLPDYEHMDYRDVYTHCMYCSCEKALWWGIRITACEGAG